MNKLGRFVFAVTLIGLGVLGLIRGDFMPVWEPVPRTAPAREALSYVVAVLSIGCGASLVVRRSTAIGARVLLALLLLWIALFRVPQIVRAPGEFGSWDGCAETVVIVAGAWALTAWRVRIARVLYGLCMIPFALAHFIYPDQTAELVPSWLPAHLPLAYLTGGAFLAAGVAVLIGVRARLAAALSAVQMGLFTVLVWIPIVAVGSAPAFAWSELGISIALTAAGWVIADSY